MFASQILLRARFSIAEIGVRVCADQWTPTDEYEELVRVEWERMRTGVTHPLWDGTYYRVLNAAELKDSAASRPGTMRLGTVRYRYIATLPALWEQHTRCGLEPLEHLSIGALIRTRDGYYLFGRRAQDGSIDMIGGGVQSDEMVVGSGGDLEENLYKEIREEVGIGRADIHALEGIGMVRSATSNMILVGHARTVLSKADAEARFAARTDPEMAEPEFVAEDELSEFLRASGDYRRLVAELL
ncbi:MAG TPA: NUDIX hydrolase [Terracidiphilus sp.]|nr:NUDIX hydrolase [Terracidiphilus sp.]